MKTIPFLVFNFARRASSVAAIAVTILCFTRGVLAQVTTGRIIKWDQPPALAASTNIYYGWNQYSVISPLGGTNSQIAADDWVCTTTNPVMKIRWWGSFIGFTGDDPTSILPADFRINFWTDQPKDAADPFSHPMQAIWQIVCTNFTWRCVGQDFDPRTGTFETCFLFEQTLSPQEWFYQNPLNGTNIYWLSIAGEYFVGQAATFPFGWKTRPRDPASPAPDNAVTILDPNNPAMGAVWVNGQPIIWPAVNGQWDLAFELVTVGNAGAKWEQPPDLSPLGIDVNATRPSGTVPPPYLLADDFLCTTQELITNIVIWGSWSNDILPINAVGMPDATNVTFILSFHDDIPAAQSPFGYSIPGTTRVIYTFPPGSYNHSVLASNIQEGWLNPPGDYKFPGDHVCHQYEFNFTLQNDPFLQDGSVTNPKVFWLDVQAVPVQGNAQFGWKTSTTNWNDAAVWIPGIEAIPSPGPWNKLSFPATHPKAGTNIDMAFRLNTGSTATELVKWSQPPVIATNPGNWYNGWNEPSINGGGVWNGIPLTNIVADDWLCTNARPVSDIHWWGSFLNWQGTALPPQRPIGFHFSIWKDIPQSPASGFSHPGQCLWDYVASTTDPNLRIAWAGWDLDPRSDCLDVESCFQFDYFLPQPNWFFQAAGSNVYWLSIAAMYPGSDVGQNPFGWKTRPHVPVPPDDAVRIFEPLVPSPGVNFINGEPIEFPAGTSWDMAFRLTTCQQFPLTNIVVTNIVVTNLTTIGGPQVALIKWNAEPGLLYQLQQAPYLTNTPPTVWADIGDPVVGPGNTFVVTNSYTNYHFFRIYMPDICPPTP
jgi:hypothetical protein